jgi:hypothetical protein
MSEARINLPAKIFPTGNFETHEDLYGKGGFVVLNDSIGSSGADEFINQRVTYQRRKEGMLVYVSSNETYYRCVVTGSSESEGEWTKQYFVGRYFHGATAPTASDIQLGEKWFDTVVGTEYTYIPIADGSTFLAWVDIDHIGKDTTADTDNFITRSEAEDLYVDVSGDTMTGTLTGPFATFTQGITTPNGFIGTLTGTNASFTGLTASNGFIGTLTGTNASFTGLTTSNGFIGTLTGTEASFSSITASNGFIGTLTGTEASFSSITASDGFIGTLTGTEASFSSITASNGFIGTLTGTNASFTGLTASNGFIGTLTGTEASFSSITASNGFIGTLTGTNASFTGLTASNGFIGTLTGTNASFTGLTTSNGFIGTLTGTEASFSSITASNGFIGTLTGTEASFSSITASNGFIGTLTGTNASFTGLTASNGFIGTLTGTNASFTGLTTSNGFIGTLTGTEASFSSITASNGFIGTLTGTEASFSSITASDGFIGTLTGNYVRIGSDPSYILNFGSTADQSVYSGDNPNVPVIKSLGGVLIGGNDDDKQNWLGNNVFLAPEGNVFVGIPSNIPTDWFSADGGTYPFNLYSLNVTGGIHTDRAYRWGYQKGENTFLDDEFVTRKSVMMRRAVQSGSNPIQFSQTWSQSSGSNDFLFASLTTKKMGFDFPVDLTFRVAGSVGGDGLYSTRWFVKNIANVKPTVGNTISIYVDRDKQITWSNGNINCASVSGGDSNTYNIGGYIQDNNGNGEAWCFLEIAPSPTGPISYGE